MHERLRELRLALGLTQKAFGEKIGLQNSSIATYESGRNKPSGAAIKQICDRFRVNERWLRTGEGEMFVPCSPDEELSEALEKILLAADGRRGMEGARSARGGAEKRPGRFQSG